MTAGNSCGVNDGAAAVALVDAATHRSLGVPGLRVLATATAGVDPELPGLGLVPAVRAALDRAGLGPGRPGRRRAQRGLRRPGARLLRRARAGRPTASAPRAARWRSGTPGARPVRCSWSGCSPSWSGPAGDATGWRRSPSAAGRAWPWWSSDAGDRGARGRARVRRPDRCLRDLDVTLTEQRIGVVGANGSGKSTFARMLNGLVLPTPGPGQRRRPGHPHAGPRVRRRVGFCFTDPDAQIVMPTVAEDVAFGLRRRGLSKAEVAERVRPPWRRTGSPGTPTTPPTCSPAGRSSCSRWRPCWSPSRTCW